MITNNNSLVVFQVLLF